MLKKAIVFLLILLFLSLAVPRFLCWYFSIAKDEPDESYDFIIVGAGTTGSVVANRLSEINDVRILLLEAGGEDQFNLFSTVPFLIRTLQRTEVDWHYETESQLYSGGFLNNQKSFWPRGKVLGGTSVLNWMVYSRGSRFDFDAWQELGAKGWSYKDVLPYFKKSEKAIAPELKKSKFHGQNGYLAVDILKQQKATDWFLEAGNEIGYKIIDYNEEDEGFAAVQSTISEGKKMSSADAFLYPFAKQRNNLDIVTNAHVTSVLLEHGHDDKPKAVGVEFFKNGKTHTAKATKEVILSAGAIETPHLMMLSGIGEKEVLEKHKIKAFVDLPGVGANLQDHTFVYVGFSYPSADVSGITFSLNEVLSPQSIFDYFYNGKGILASSGIEAFSYFKTNTDDPNKRFNYPDIYMIFLPVQLDLGSPALRQQRCETMNIKEEYVNGLANQTKENDVLVDFGVLITVAHPKSLGSIRLNSSDPKDHPKIDPRYLSNKHDVQTYIRAFQILEKIEQSKAFQSRGIKLALYAPYCDGYTEAPRSDEFYECVVRSQVLTEYHPTGTAKMGREDDRMAVVDPRLRVYKVNGLRVADASVMPEITASNTQAPCYMIGEKASDMIKEDWKLKR